MQKFQAILLLFAVSVLSFTGVPSNGIALARKTYGTCGFGNAASVEQKVALTLHPDQTFHYRNAADTSHPVEVNGHWNRNGNKVVLQGSNNESNFHRTWKIDKDQACVTSRKGLYFIRLCDIEACK